MRLLYRIAHALRKLWWRVRRPQTLGVKVLVRNQSGQVLLVKPTYEDVWQIPGGGVNRYEHPATAGSREILEETGISISSADLKLLDVFVSKHEGKSDCVVFYTCNCNEITAIPDGQEIEDARFFEINALPTNIAGSVNRRIVGDHNNGTW